ncbi:MAG: hypothetical protein AAGF23_07995 [Acidobacteriota bacterium]
MATASDRRLWVANLDAEEAWRPGSTRTLPRRVLGRLAVFGALFAVQTRPGDALWLPTPFDRARLPGLHPDVALLGGAPREVLRAHRSYAVRPWADAAPWVDGARSAAAARVNDRRFGLALGRRLDVADPRAAVLDDPGALRRWLDRWSGLDRWVVKAPFSASGRDRHVHLGGPSPDGRAIERLFARHGELVAEPWHERCDDIGVLFHTDRPDSIEVHRQHIGPGGAVSAIELDVVPPIPGVEAVLPVARRVSQALRDAGYRGPAGVDAWRHRRGGATRWHALGEVNARWSVGWLARRAADALGLRPQTGVVLRSGARDTLTRATRDREVHPLVLPAPGSPGLWLEAAPRSGS